MSETPPENTNTQEQQEAPPEPAQASWDELFKDEDPKKVREALDNSRKWEKRAKENKGAADEAERQRLAAMSEQERAIEEARSAARSEATSAFGKRLATSDIRAAAATAGADLSGVFDFLDLSRFVGDDGEPDDRAIKSFVDGLPKQADPTPSFDGGSRTPAPAPQGMSQAIRKAAGRA